MRGPFHTDADSSTPSLKPEKISSIIDGTSATIAAGERTTAAHPTRGSFWADGFDLYSVSGAYTSSATLLNNYDLCGQEIGVDSSDCKYGWGSFHTSGINFLMCDGSVHCISPLININVFCAMGTIANGSNEPVFPGF